MLPEDQQECDERHKRTDPVRQRLGVEGTSGSEEYGKDYGKQHIVSFPEYREEERSPASSQGGETVYKYILEAKGNDHQCEYLDSPYTEICLSGISGEDADEILRDRSGYQEHNGSKAQTQQQYVFFRRFYPVNVFGTVIVA